jgi:hypothetical protein
MLTVTTERTGGKASRRHAAANNRRVVKTILIDELLR